eukprot:Selendium_serpulae@DN4550_c0_g2_i1.p1
MFFYRELSGISASHLDAAVRQCSFFLERNGTRAQHGDPTQMLNSPSKIIEAVQRSMTLVCGDVLMTGTPAGVGTLAPGDKLTLGLSFGNDDHHDDDNIIFNKFVTSVNFDVF